jgi:hypothetical protein
MSSPFRKYLSRTCAFAVLVGLALAPLAAQTAPAKLPAPAAPAPAATARDYRADLSALAGAELSPEQLALAEFSLAYTLVKANLANMAKPAKLGAGLATLSPADYRQAVGVAWTLAKQPAAQGMLKLGLAGETLLKALIVTAEDAFAVAKRAIADQAAEYDRRNP